ncbi:MarR family transcriptional regulator [Methanocella sp. MCL-LM]|uniref:MarR family transcriptional regulator n=1 Tax=Methanocella sp. MCL-LM TaxID=3412035 RepID=UPI003C70CED3
MADASEVKDAFASSRIDMARYTLIMVFLIEQRWRYYIEKELEPDGITAKQWLMLIVIGAGFRHAPSIQEVADAMSTTHQNVKQVAAAMERQGFMTLERDPENRRIIRLKVTPKCHDLFRTRDEHDKKAMLSMFENLTDEEMGALFNIVAKLEARASQLYGSAKANRLENGKGAGSE